MTHKPGMFDRIDRAAKPLLMCGLIYVVFWMVIPAIKMMMNR